MTTIDERVVSMKFNNSAFQKNIEQTTKSLTDLKSKLTFEKASESLSRLSAIGTRFNLSNISSSLDTISNKFTELNGVAIVALGNIATKAISAGAQLLKSLTITPINAGLDEYELKMGSIQTILANTSKYGTTLKDVNSALDALNDYSDKTIYNFGAMTKNIGLFTNAGIKLEDAVSMIKGFSNAAAASGVTAENAAGAAYQLSQAMSAGTVRLMDWRSLTNAGMGGANMKQGLVDLAQSMGTLGKLTPTGVMKDFNGSLQQGWLSADVMTKYLSIMAGDMNEAEMATLGLSKAQIKNFKQQQKTAEEAATKIRTYTQLLGTLKESVASSWAETFSLVIGDFNEATDLFTNVNNEFGKLISASSNARNNLLKDWKDLGGRTKLIDGIANIFKALKSVIDPIAKAFREIFPATTAKQLYDLTSAFTNFTKNLIIGKKVSNDLKRTFKGLFAVLDIIGMVFKAAFEAIGALLGPVSKTGNGIASFTGDIGDFLVSVRDFIKSGNIFGNVFTFIGNAIKFPIDLFNQLTNALTNNNPVVSGTADVWKNLSNVFMGIWEFIKPGIDWLMNALKLLGEGIISFFKTLDFNSFLALGATGLLGALTAGVFKISKILKGGLDAFKDGFFTGLTSRIKDILNTVKDTLKSLQTEVQSRTIKNIAVALLILAGAVLILSFIPVDRLVSSLTALTVMLVQLMAIMVLFEKNIASKGAAKFVFITGALILLSTAMLIFATAVTIISKLSWDELARGLVGMSFALILMLNASKFISKNVGNITVAAFAIGILSAALLVLGSALKLFASMTWEEIGKSLTVLGSLLIMLSLFTATMDKIGLAVVNVFTFLALAAALSLMAYVLKQFSKLSWEEIAKGLITMALSLGIIAGALKLIPLTAGVTALNLIAVAGALFVIANVLEKMAGMTWDEVGRGLTVMAGSLAILAGALYLMTGTLAGAGALIVAALALSILAVPLKIFSTLNWEQVAVGLVFLAGSLAIIAGAGYLLIGALPGLLGLGAAILLVGIGAYAAGIGLFLISGAIVAITAALSIGAVALVEFVKLLIGLIPSLAEKMAEGFIAFIKSIGASTDVIFVTMVNLLTTIVNAIATVAPLVIKTVYDLIWTILSTIEKNLPRFIKSGSNILVAFINGIANNLPRIINAGANLIVAYLRGIKKEFPRIVDEGFKTVIGFIDGLAEAIKVNAPKLREAGQNLAFEILNGITGGLAGGARDLFNGAVDLGNEALEGIKSALGIKSPSKEFMEIGRFSNLGLANGLSKYSNIAVDAATNVGLSAVDSLKKSVSKISELAFNELDMNPTIRPVLDLSAIKKDSLSIGSMLQPASISVGSAYAQASSIALEQRASRSESSVSTEETSISSDTNITFIQNNNSPKALSASEIYRQTKNQISAVKLTTAV
jgi:tape measure domain-containing protein